MGADEAVFECTRCYAERVFGNSTPDDPSYRPMLRCEHCKQMTRHQFITVRDKRRYYSGEWWTGGRA